MHGKNGELMESVRSGTDDFSSLMARARDGDPAAVAELYDRHARRVMAIVRRRLSVLLRAKYDTMDLAHSVFVEVLRELPRLEDRGEGAFARLLAIKAENKVRLKLRRHLGAGGRRMERPLPDDEAAAVAGDVSGAAADADDRAKLKRVLADLDETSRGVLHLHSEGWAFAEIAQALDLASAGAARQRYARALAVLRRRWEKPAARNGV